MELGGLGGGGRSEHPQRGVLGGGASYENFLAFREP